MKSETPKVMHPVAGIPMVEHVLRVCHAAGIRNTVTVISADGDEVRSALSLEGNQFAVQERQLGTGDAVKAARSSLETIAGLETVLVLNGDIPLLNASLLRDLCEARKSQKAALAIAVGQMDDPAGYGRAIRDKNGLVQAIVEHKDCSPEQRRIREWNAGIYAVEAGALWRALDQITDANSQKEYYLTDIVSILAGESKVVCCLETDSESLQGINDREQLAQANEAMNQRNLKRHMAAGVTILQRSTTWIETDVEIGPDTVILPFTVIRRGVRIGAHCEVGPFSQLRGATILDDHASVGNFTEVKKSHLGSHSKAKHLAYLGDTKVGAGANIGAGTITANYDGSQKHETVIGEDAHIGSNTTLVAPVTIGKGARTGAGSVVTRGSHVADGETVVGVPARPLKRED